MTDTMTKRRVKPAKLGMTVKPPKPNPYARISRITEAGVPEEERLEKQGRGKVSEKAAKPQKRIPKVNPRMPRKGSVA